jgi:protein-S-isoprenylcysteine O-methyltransferase Ste14
MTSLTLFQISAAILGALFIAYGMDVRRKPGARNFVGRSWQFLMKACAFALIGGFMWLVLSMTETGAIDWLGLVLMASGTAFVAAAKSALGSTHTFTGQYLEKPVLVMDGVYAFTRNPLYLGVFQCELGVLLCAVHQVPVLLPQNYGYWLGGFGLALLYAVAFNLMMAVREARQLELQFGEDYRQYRARVPLFIPTLMLESEIS